VRRVRRDRDTDALVRVALADLIDDPDGVREEAIAVGRAKSEYLVEMNSVHPGPCKHSGGPVQIPDISDPDGAPSDHHRRGLFRSPPCVRELLVLTSDDERADPSGVVGPPGNGSGHPGQLQMRMGVDEARHQHRGTEPANVRSRMPAENLARGPGVDDALVQDRHRAVPDRGARDGQHPARSVDEHRRHRL